MSQKQMKNCVYRFIDENNQVIYVGKATNLKERLKGHTHLPKTCYLRTVKIEYCNFNTSYDMDFAERYFIPKFNPEFNTVLSGKELSLNIVELDQRMWNTYNPKIYKHDKKKIQPTSKAIQKWSSGVDIRSRKLDKALEVEAYRKNQVYKDKVNQKIICNYTGEIFNNMQDVADEYNVDLQTVFDNCEGMDVFPKMHKKYKCNITFSYFKTFNHKNMETTIEKYTRKVICITNNETYDSMWLAGKAMNVSPHSIKRCCNSFSHYCKVLNNKPLVWCWYDKYKNMSSQDISEKLEKAWVVFERRNLNAN